jgi:predicted amidophosphoribosyltransferase
MADQLPLAAFPACQRCGNFRSGPAEVCLACAARQLARPGPGTCSVCAQFLAANGACPNELCGSPRRRIGRIHAIGYQSGPLREAISAYKYRGARSMSGVFGRLLVAWLEETLAADPPGLIVANPSFVGAGGQGFAHTEAVLTAAAQVDRGGRWAFDTGTPAAIIKTGATLQSADAQAWSKRAIGYELRAALQVTELARTAGKFVLVYDDVCTTGTQLDTVAGCLLDHGGAARVEGIVLARAPWRGGAQRAG